jgi:hypothetical protein
MTEEISLKRKTKPFTIFVLIAILFNLTVPFFMGRNIGLKWGYDILSTLPSPTTFYAFWGWFWTMFMIFSFLVAFSGKSSHFWYTVTLVSMFVLQFFSGFCSMRWNFHNPNYIIYSDLAYKANSINIGIITGFIAFAVFLLYYLITLFVTKPQDEFSKFVHFRYAVLIFLFLQALAFGILIGFNILQYFHGTAGTIL